jgi:hypothetical protein
MYPTLAHKYSISRSIYNLQNDLCVIICIHVHLSNTSLRNIIIITVHDWGDPEAEKEEARQRAAAAAAIAEAELRASTRSSKSRRKKKNKKDEEGNDDEKLLTAVTLQESVDGNKEGFGGKSVSGGSLNNDKHLTNSTNKSTHGRTLSLKSKGNNCVIQ